MITKEPQAEAGLKITLAERRAYMSLPLAERRRQLSQQAERMVEHYESEPEATTREQWQGGDIVES